MASDTKAIATQVRRELAAELKYMITNEVVEELKNGFKDALLKDLKKHIEGDIKIQMAQAWNEISSQVEMKMTNSNMALMNAIDQFRKETSNKLEFFPSIVQSLNEISGRVRHIETQRETCLTHITRLQTQANGWGPEIKDLNKRVKYLEDRPGRVALKNRTKLRWIIISALFGLMAGGGPFFVKWLISLF